MAHPEATNKMRALRAPRASRAEVGALPRPRAAPGRGARSSGHVARAPDVTWRGSHAGRQNWDRSRVLAHNTTARGAGLPLVDWNRETPRRSALPCRASTGRMLARWLWERALARRVRRASRLHGEPRRSRLSRSAAPQAGWRPGRGTLASRPGVSDPRRTAPPGAV